MKNRHGTYQPLQQSLSALITNLSLTIDNQENLHLSVKPSNTMTEGKDEQLKEYTSAEVSKHTLEEDCWMIIGNESNGT